MHTFDGRFQDLKYFIYDIHIQSGKDGMIAEALPCEINIFLAPLWYEKGPEIISEVIL